MSVDFPNSPSLNDTFTSNDKVWRWDGEKWILVAAGLPGPAGPTGATGPVGATGPQGSWSLAQTIRSITGALDIPTSADNGRLLVVNTSSGAVTITINSSLGLSAGNKIDFVWWGSASSLGIVGSGVNLFGTPGTTLRARYSAATLVCISSNNYLLVGDLLA